MSIRLAQILLSCKVVECGWQKLQRGYIGVIYLKLKSILNSTMKLSSVYFWTIHVTTVF